MLLAVQQDSTTAESLHWVRLLRRLVRCWRFLGVTDRGQGCIGWAVCQALCQVLEGRGPREHLLQLQGRRYVQAEGWELLLACNKEAPTLVVTYCNRPYSSMRLTVTRVNHVLQHRLMAIKHVEEGWDGYQGLSLVKQGKTPRYSLRHE